MLNEILMKVISVIIGFIIPGILGYFIATVKNYKKNENNQQEALKCLLRSSITKMYYEYMPKGYIPSYEKENLTYLNKIYEEMNGNSYVKVIFPEMMKLPVRDEK